jgi:hypothetical protein
LFTTLIDEAAQPGPRFEQRFLAFLNAVAESALPVP